MPRLGASPTLYEFGYSAWLMSSDDASQQTFPVLYQLVARWQQYKTTVNADKSRDMDSERTAGGRNQKTLKGTPAQTTEADGGFVKGKKTLKRERAALAAALLTEQQLMPPDQLTILTKQMASLNLAMATVKGKGKGKGKGDKGAKGIGKQQGGQGGGWKGAQQPGGGKGKGQGGKQMQAPVPGPPLTRFCESFQVGRCTRTACKYEHALDPGAMARYWWRKSTIAGTKGGGALAGGAGGPGPGANGANAGFGRRIG